MLQVLVIPAPVIVTTPDLEEVEEFASTVICVVPLLLPDAGL